MPDWMLYLAILFVGIVIGRMTKRSDEVRHRTAPAPAPPHPLPTETEARVRALLADRKKLEAIKVYRKAAGCGLKEAKERVEAIGSQRR